MEIPEGWRVGHTKNVSPQWVEQWHETVAKAQSENDLMMLRVILDDRKDWCAPITIRRMSKALERRGNEIDVSIRPVRNARKETESNRAWTSFSHFKDDGTIDRTDQITARMLGEGAAE